MRTGARIQAAIEVLEMIIDRHRPASAALADWGKAHRFAGSGDRSAIGTLVYDVLRKRAILSEQMKSDTPRALALAAAPEAFAITSETVAEVIDGSRHAPKKISDEERAQIAVQPKTDTLADHIAGNFPEWLAPSLERAFASRVVEEGMAMSQRAPVDLRVNTLTANREDVLQALKAFSPGPTRYSPLGVRLNPPKGAKRQANVEAEPSHGKGWFEVQDEASQLAALLVGAEASHSVLDLCAGAGGKTLALAAQMKNAGTLAAYDSNKRQLRPIFDRMRRATADNIDVLNPGDVASLKDLGPVFDRVLVDAPCTGTGTWRRRPDAKWRLKKKNIAQRQAEQQSVLSLASGLVRPGGQLIYVTCSLLPEENVDQVTWFCDHFPDYKLVPYVQQWRQSVSENCPTSADGQENTLLLSPAMHQMDGFFIAILQRQ